MSDFKRIPYYNLRAEAARGTLPRLVGRREELLRVARILGRRINNNCLVVGPRGGGKTALLYGLIRRMARDPRYGARPLVQFDAAHLYEIEGAQGTLQYEKALATLPSGTLLVIDDLGRFLHNNHTLVQRIASLYGALLKRPDVQVLATLERREYEWLLEAAPAFTGLFEAVQLKAQSGAEYAEVLTHSLARLNREYKIVVPSKVLRSIVEYVERFPALGQMPRAATLILDECLACAAVEGKKQLGAEIVATVVAGKTGVPLSSLRHNEIASLKALEADLNARVVSQAQGIAKIASTITRAKLGMRNPGKPLGSFLILGPSGVGKTETAKLVAEKVFGRPESFTRFDMSEFGQEYTVQRLIGAPPGYVGYEGGGALTNALKSDPHSLVLLDEVEKAHPKVFDIFLQVLDDGRLTSGKNETVDARHAIFMATSNIAVTEIVEGARTGEDIHGKQFMDEKLLPALMEYFRPEFLNRFDAILVFNPLTMADLVRIAELEIKKVEQRLAHHNVRFAVDPEVLRRKIETIADPRFGARPVKRFIEEICENMLAKSLLSENQRV